MGDRYHVPVLADEVVEMLNIKNHGFYIDCTIGTGGHSERILEENSTVKLLGIDLDSESLGIAESRLKKFGRRFELIQGNFVNLSQICLSAAKADGIFFDLGMSLYQIENQKRGFSFYRNGPLDMRFDNKNGKPAYCFIDKIEEKKLIEILRNYGEEKFSKRIARAIVNSRPIHTSLELARIIRDAIPRGYYKRINPATKTFQAIRIAVNNELENLKKGISSAINHLKSEGRICVISFHSLEDRIVKQELKTFCGSGILRNITKKPMRADYDEIRINPKSRSAKMRVAEKI